MRGALARRHVLLVVAAEYPPQSEPDEVARAQPLHDRESDGGGCEDGRDPERGEGDVHQGTRLHAEHGDKSGRFPSFHTARDYVEDRRSRTISNTRAAKTKRAKVDTSGIGDPYVVSGSRAGSAARPLIMESARYATAATPKVKNRP